MAVIHAAGALFLDVGHFAVRRDLTILAGYATAPERCEANQANQTHHGAPPAHSVHIAEQSLYRSVRRVDDRIRSGIPRARMKTCQSSGVCWMTPNGRLDSRQPPPSGGRDRRTVIISPP